MAPRYLPSSFLKPLIPAHFNTTANTTSSHPVTTKPQIVSHALSLIPRTLNTTAHYMPNLTWCEHPDSNLVGNGAGVVEEHKLQVDVNKIEDGVAEGKKLFWSIGMFLILMVALAVFGCLYGWWCCSKKRRSDKDGDGKDGVERDINGHPIREEMESEAEKEGEVVVGERVAGWKKKRESRGKRARERSE